LSIINYQLNHMKIYETSVRKPISTILIFVGAIVLGLFSLNRLSVDLYPDMEIPYISIITSYTGASAADIEQNITRRLESSLNTVSNLKKITSRSQENMSIITLEFDWGSNLDEASNDVRDVVGRMETYLPEGAEKPFIVKLSSSMMPIINLYATAEESYGGLYKLLDEKVANPLNRIDGVGAVNISGAAQREIQVNVDPKKIEAYHLTIEQIGQKIQMENLNIPAGAMDIGSERLSIRTQAEFVESSELNNLVIANYGGREIKLRDVAVVKDTVKKMTVEETLNGLPCVRISVQKQSGANSVDICEKVKEMLPELEASLPSDVKLGVLFDTSDFIKNSINSLTETVLLAFVFVTLVVLFFLGRWRATIIICLTIPISLVTAFIYLMFTGGTLNIISLSSLTIAIGLVVDDAIVVLENITKHIERKARPRDAAIYGTNEVWLAVIATTLTIVAVFLPLTMVGGMAGIMFKQLGWIISIVIVVSAIAAFTIVPMLAAKMMKFNLQRYKGFGIIFKPTDKFLANLDNWYAKLVGWTVTHKAITIIGAAVIFLSSLLLLRQVPTSFMPDTDNGRLQISVDLPVNYNLEQTSAFAHKLEGRIKELVPEIQYIQVSSGVDDKGGFAALFGNSGINSLSMTIILVDRKERERKQAEIADIIRDEIDKHPEPVKYSAGGGMVGAGFLGGSGVAVKIYGYDFNTTTAVAKELAEKMKNVPGARDVTVSRDEMRTELNIDFDREKLARFGINTATAATFVRNRINGMTASLFREDGEEYYIIVRYDEKFRNTIEDIENITLMNNLGQTVKLSEVAKITEGFTPPIIEREDRQRVVTVSAALGAGVALSKVANEARAIIKQMNKPAGVEIAIAGSVESQEESFNDMFTLLGLIILLVYIVMATQFESLSKPLIIILFTVPFAFTGVFVALWLTGTALDLIALIGAIMLVGIVVKNGILLIDFTNLQRERGLPLLEAVVTAGKSRLRPVLMTSAATILGMLPLATGIGEGSEIWQPMGIAVVGGLTFSTVLTLLVVPAIYATFNIGAIKRERKDNRIEIDTL